MDSLVTHQKFPYRCIAYIRHIQMALFVTLNICFKCSMGKQQVSFKEAEITQLFSCLMCFSPSVKNCLFIMSSYHAPFEGGSECTYAFLC